MSVFTLLTKESVAIDDLRFIYRQWCSDPAFVAETISALEQLDVEIAWRATWLLLEAARDNLLNEKHTILIAEAAAGMSHWVARLNLCQLFACVGCTAAVREMVFPFLEDCFQNRRVIIRAWAISALMSFAGDPLYRTGIAAMRREAQKDRSKSMQARLRKLETATVGRESK